MPPRHFDTAQNTSTAISASMAIFYVNAMHFQMRHYVLASAMAHMQKSAKAAYSLFFLFAGL